jgi:hypothetical protein
MAPLAPVMATAIFFMPVCMLLKDTTCWYRNWFEDFQIKMIVLFYVLYSKIQRCLDMGFEKVVKIRVPNSSAWLVCLHPVAKPHFISPKFTNKCFRTAIFYVGLESPTPKQYDPEKESGKWRECHGRCPHFSHYG